MMSRAIQGFLAVIVFGAAALGTYYIVREEPSCTRPLTYHIASVDSRFGVSESELESMLLEAAALWNAAAGKDVLVASENGDVSVSLVYDERQATVSLGTVISSEQESYDQKRAAVDARIKAHEKATGEHQARVAAFDAAVSSYEESVAYWNARGGAPPDEFRALENERRRLARLESELNEEATSLNLEGERVNRDVVALNALASRVNAKVDTYNAVAGQEFDQGQYISDENGTRITIYEFETREQLVRALAHEFGHALGIGHTENPESLMYPYNEGSDIALHKEDVTALREVCAL